MVMLLRRRIRCGLMGEARGDVDEYHGEGDDDEGGELE